MSKSDVTEAPLLFIDTAGLDMLELDTPDEESKGNEGMLCTYVRGIPKVHMYLLEQLYS